MLKHAVVDAPVTALISESSMDEHLTGSRFSDRVQFAGLGSRRPSKAAISASPTWPRNFTNLRTARASLRQSLGRVNSSAAPNNLAPNNTRFCNPTPKITRIGNFPSATRNGLPTTSGPTALGPSDSAMSNPDITCPSTISTKSQYTTSPTPHQNTNPKGRPPNCGPIGNSPCSQLVLANPTDLG
jgi:hypothetical protein